MKFATVLKISRPRFWSYLAGPYAVGFAAGAVSLQQFAQWQFWLLLLFFLFPANLLLYGINDWFDEATDALNSKKSEQEHRLQAQQRRSLLFWLASMGIVALFILGLIPHFAVGWLVLFLFLSYSYSAPPLRFKSRPFWDSYSNVLYSVPGFLAYALASGQQISWLVLIAAWSWVVGMHAFSAIPDIGPDRQAGVRTVATFMGKEKALWFVAAHWLVTSVLAIWLGGPLFVLVLIYPLIPLAVKYYSRVTLTKVYWWFPWINAVLGALLFWKFFLMVL